MNVEENEIESRRFGVRFARLQAASVSADALHPLLAEADAREIDVISTRVKSSEIAAVHDLENAGFRIMDTLVYYTGRLSHDQSAPSVNVREISSDRAAGCALVASRSFHQYVGHYHADAKLSRVAADEVYVDWATRLVDSPAVGQISLGVFADDRLTGFLIGVPREDGRSEIILNAVDPDVQKRGLYKNLFDEYLRLASLRHGTEVLVSTQIQNYPVQRVWARSGFHLSQSFYTLHRWKQQS